MSGTNVTKATLAQRIRDLIAGTQKHPQNGQLTFGGATFTDAALIQLLQELANATAAADSARANWQDALKNARAEQAKVVPIIQAYRSWLVTTYGNAPALLADYGVTPHKAPTPLTTDQQAEALAKRAATRTARHTMGTKQKKQVKGTVSTVTTTPPPAAPPVNAPAPKPAS
jgi:hypothetical protein